jgi:IPT/TIG domain
MASKAGNKANRHPERPVKGANSSLEFKTTASDQLVLILVGAQGTGSLALSGINATTLQNATYGALQSPAIASAAAYTAQLSVGKHKAKWHTKTYAPNAGTSIGAVAYVLAPAPAPTITGIGPNSGPEAGGTAVTITGTNLDGATGVQFGSTAAESFKVNSPTSIEAVSPSGSGTVQITVLTPDGTSATNAADQFHYIPPPPPSITAEKGGPFRGGYELDAQVHNFPLGTFVYSCHDNSGPGGSEVVYFSHAVEVTNPNQTTWPGVFCYDSAPYVSYLEMDGVRSNSVQF